MSGRRSARSKQPIDYTNFGGGEEMDDDDDFAEPTPPPAKKPKREPKEPKAKKDKKENDLIKKAVPPGRPKKERLPLEEKIFERELELALSMSANESLSSEGVAVVTIADVSATSEGTRTAAATGVPCGDLDRVRCNTALTNAAVEGPLIEALEELPEEEMAGGRKRRRAAVKPQRGYADSGDAEDEGDEENISGDNRDVDFKPQSQDAVDSDVALGDDDDDESSLDGDDDADDSDFDDGRHKKAAKGKTTSTSSRGKPPARATSTPKGTKKPTATGRGTGAKKSVPKSQVTPKGRGGGNSWGESGGVESPALTSTNSPFRSSICNVRSPLGGGSIKSPGISLGGVTIKSPGGAFGGGIRLGLSRKARVKPLHVGIQLS